MTICASCDSDAFGPTSVTGRGMHLGFWSRSKNGGLSTYLRDIAQEADYTLTALVETPRPSGISAKLQYEGFSAKLHKIFEYEIQVGDKSFDDLVWIRTNTREATAALLAIPGVRRAVSELIEMKAVIELEEARIYVTAESSASMSPKDFVLYTAILGHYLSLSSSG